VDTPKNQDLKAKIGKKSQKQTKQKTAKGQTKKISKIHSFIIALIQTL